MAERKAGFYWVRDKDNDWQVAHTIARDWWWLTGSTECLDDGAFAEIGERVERQVPQPITDAQKTGERFLVWLRHPPHDDTPGRWVIAGWGIKNNHGAWTTERFGYPEQFVTHYLPMPPDVKL